MFQSLKKKKGIIISGFAGIGKTNFQNYVPYYEKNSFYDLSSSSFRKDEGWEDVYIDCAEAFCEKYDFVFVSAHQSVLEKMKERKCNFYVVYPRKHCRDEYKERFEKRGSSPEYIAKFMMRWNEFVDKIDNFDYDKKIQLRTGQYLSDVVSRIR